MSSTSPRERLEQVLADLTAEGDQLDGWVADLPVQEWGAVTTPEGWTVAHQVGHLAWTDETSLAAVTDAEAFGALLKEAAQDPTGYVDTAADTWAAKPVPMLLDAWRAGREALADALRAVPDGERVPWFGPPMSPTSMASARFMETWAHAHDVAETFGIEVPRTDRVRHVCHLGVRTRGFAYVMRGAAGHGRRVGLRAARDAAAAPRRRRRPGRRRGRRPLARRRAGLRRTPRCRPEAALGALRPERRRLRHSCDRGRGVPGTTVRGLGAAAGCRRSCGVRVRIGRGRTNDASIQWARSSPVLGSQKSQRISFPDRCVAHAGTVSFIGPSSCCHRQPTHTGRGCGSGTPPVVGAGCSLTRLLMTGRRRLCGRPGRSTGHWSCEVSSVAPCSEEGATVPVPLQFVPPCARRGEVRRARPRTQ